MNKKFGPSYPGHYPDEMRTQLWPLCCGARIISGFKHVHTLTEDELVKQINETIDNAIPDHQVFGYEQMMPKLTFLTLNSSQMSSNKIMTAVKAAGFIKIGEGKPRGSSQGFFLQDKSHSFFTVPVQKGLTTETFDTSIVSTVKAINDDEDDDDYIDYIDDEYDEAMGG